MPYDPLFLRGLSLLAFYLVVHGLDMTNLEGGAVLGTGDHDIDARSDSSSHVIRQTSTFSNVLHVHALARRYIHEAATILASGCAVEEATVQLIAHVQLVISLQPHDETLLAGVDIIHRRLRGHCQQR